MDKFTHYKNIKILNNLEFKDGKFTKNKPQQPPRFNAGPDFLKKKNDVDKKEDSIAFFEDQFKAS